ncbi:MAG: excinuclease ABC subunit C [Deltaproteobacteria bacterium HGW-Deltaproteobacteria-11]|nr:MAG: excinuclease ABC subunit C [Deltaproteobacteria bacterium HGW-Deltaproteobacteria-11]
MERNVINRELEHSIQNAPRAPGVYLMKDGDDRILYVGKAKNLRARVRAYFGGTDGRAMIPFLVSRVQAVAFIVTATEKEALILENTLIKEHRPRYNVNFRDDKSYYHLRIDLEQPFPRFELVRRPRKDGAACFGPYPSSVAARETLRFLQLLFPLRTCRDREMKTRQRPCLEYQIRRCLAPCAGRVEEAAYRELVRDAVAFLEGKEKALVADLQARMAQASENLQFEAAAALRDRVAAITATLEIQRMVSLSGGNQDVYGIYREGDLTQACALFIRQGKLLGQKDFPLLKLGGPTQALLSSLIKQYYDGAADLPDAIIVPETLEDQTVIAEWLTDKMGKKVTLGVARRGQGRDLLKMARLNAENVFKAASLTADGTREALRLLMEKLALKHPPEHIECFDISNIGGRWAVGAMVTFLAGTAWKPGYRRFRIRTVAGADDYGMLYEVLHRRYREKERLPDLIVVDGGKGQLGVALSVLKDLGIEGVAAIGLAKERDDAQAFDRVYLPRRKDPVPLYRWPAAQLLLQRIRDEAHRFAVSYHRKVKEKEDLQSVLEKIPGVGRARKKALLTFFGDLRRIELASPEELQEVPGLGRAQAQKIHAFFQSEKN